MGLDWENVHTHDEMEYLQRAYSFMWSAKGGCVYGKEIFMIRASVEVLDVKGLLALGRSE